MPVFMQGRSVLMEGRGHAGNNHASWSHLNCRDHHMLLRLALLLLALCPWRAAQLGGGIAASF